MELECIGQRIKEIRLEHGLSQQRFGAILSVSQDTVSLWEMGKSAPTTEFLIAIAKNFEVSVDYILCLKDY
ncbi:MAG: helix-turn-helix transcriptional regulator [Clostridiales bacterium]|nr:helix-turn-helix transcriptional regulator [Clostridiales bacterium]